VKQLEKECGVTQVSLKNADILIEEHGLPALIHLHLDENKDWLVTATFEGGVTHAFSGFSWGYCGEGPRGLRTFLDKSGVPTEMDEIAQWKEDLDKKILPRRA
jgi:hypothetical protein